jgi:hypothetical protein
MNYGTNNKINYSWRVYVHNVFVCDSAAIQKRLIYIHTRARILEYIWFLCFVLFC